MTDSDTSISTEQPETTVTDAEYLADRVIENVERVVVGHREAIVHLLVALFAGGHVLVEDVPGVGKTVLAKSLARSFDADFERLQFTPDMLPSDVTGVNVYNEATGEFEFRSGPVFANVIVGDEINRAPPKTQSALLEAMEERQVTVDGETYEVPRPFSIIATQNDVERGQTYELPLAQRDRFMKRLSLGYPDGEEEVQLLDRLVGKHPIEDLGPVADLDDLRAAREVVANVHVAPEIERYVTELAQYTRERADIGVSPRGTLALLSAAQARATLEGRDYVVPLDVQTEARSVLTHRIRGADDGRTAEQLIEEALRSVSVD